MIYKYKCPKCEQILEDEESMVTYSYKNPGIICPKCNIETLHLVSGSPMVRVMWNKD
jgi:DNA-directed RNA polymerase subunit RPC12/RpoP